MPLPISISNLISGRTIESSRIEYKLGWNPEKVIHTICAFANDYENIGGGYIIIGVSEEDDRPRTAIGLTDGEISALEKDLFNKCNLIQPRYMPVMSVERYQDVDIVVLWVPSNDSRPFTCPVSLSQEKGRGSERAYFIRRMSHTIRADRDEVAELMMRAKRRSFDELVNPNANIADVSRSRVLEYLRRVGSSIPESMPTEEILDSMRLTAGPREQRMVVNAALMMFSEDPERFFDRTRIEVVVKPDPTGEGMTESVFRGPVYAQLEMALGFIRSYIIRERIFKIEGQAEALRVYNFPYNAVEEVLVNAVFHKSYQIGAPVVVTLTPDALEVLSYPGLDSGITDEDIARLEIRSRGDRNRRLGDFLKELGMAEARNTGIPKIVEAMRRNGSPDPVYETDAARRYLNVVLKVHPSFRDDARQTSLGPAPSHTDEEAKGIMMESLTKEGCMTSKALCERLGYKAVNARFRRLLSELMDEGRVEYLYPNPKDSRQRICLKR